MSEYLYLIRCSVGDVQYHKIGIANDPQDRLASLQTGNPLPLLLMATYKFKNAQFVERSLHQKFEVKRGRGEWFHLFDEEVSELHQICKLLGGVNTLEDYGVGASEAEIEQAEEIQEEVFDNLDKWDYATMFADGWRMERTTNGRHIGEGSRYWCWRKGTASRGKKYIYGGVLSELPHAIEEMRRIYAQQEET